MHHNDFKIKNKKNFKKLLTKFDKGDIIKCVPFRKDKYFIKLVIIQQEKHRIKKRKITNFFVRKTHKKIF